MFVESFSINIYKGKEPRKNSTKELIRRLKVSEPRRRILQAVPNIDRPKDGHQQP
jgi:hypothetical protein